MNEFKTWQEAHETHTSPATRQFGCPFCLRIQRALFTRKGVDSVVLATIDYEVAIDDFYAVRYELDVLADESADRAAMTILKQKIDAGVEFWMSLDDAGVMDLHTTRNVEETVEAIKAYSKMIAGPGVEWQGGLSV
jgi:hypothetical protein